MSDDNSTKLARDGTRRGGARPGAGRKKSSDAAPKIKGQGRGGTRPGSCRKSKFAEVTPAALLSEITTYENACELNHLFDAARAGDLSALRQIVAIYEHAATRISGRCSASVNHGPLFEASMNGW
jgi:hypothetical protein